MEGPRCSRSVLTLLTDIVFTGIMYCIGLHAVAYLFSGSWLQLKVMLQIAQ